MKIKEIVILFSMFGCCFTNKIQLPVGIILTKNEREIEVAFLCAIDRVNMHERRFELFPITIYMDDPSSYNVERAACDLIDRKVVAIFGPTSESAAGIVSSICSALDIPHILSNWRREETKLEQEERSMTVNMFPDVLVLSTAFSTVVSSFSWNKFVILYDTDAALMQAQSILSITNIDSYPNILIQLEDDEVLSYRTQVKALREQGENFFVLNCATDKIIPFLEQASQYNLTGEYQNYFIANLDTHTLNFSALTNYQKANITTLRLMDPESVYLNNAITDWRARGYRVELSSVRTNMIIMHDAVKLFAIALNSLIDDPEDFEMPKSNCSRGWPWSMGRSLIELMKPNNNTREEGFISGPVLFTQYGQRIMFYAQIIELYSNQFRKLSEYEPSKGIIFKRTTSEIEKQEAELFRNKTFIVMSRIEEPFLMKRTPTEEGQEYVGNNRYHGFSMDLITKIAEKIGFAFEFQITADTKHGSYNPKTKKWDGVVKDLIDKKADLGIGDITITADRRKVVDFTVPFMSLGIGILFVKPAEEEISLFSFGLPFSVELWLYMATVYLMISFLVFFFSRLASDDWENPHPCNTNPEEVENIWNIRNTTWLAMGSIMGQGCDILPKASSTRTLTGVWWFFALMMVNSYTANLAAFLTSSRMEEPIRSAEDLSKQTKIKYGTVYPGTTMKFFQKSNITVYQKMWSVMESSNPSVFTSSNPDGRERVLKSKRRYAFLMESTLISYAIERNCDLVQVGNTLDVKYYGILLPLNSPYRTRINNAILELSEASYLKRLQEDWWEKNVENPCPKVTTTDDTPDLEMKNVGGVFLVLGCGIFVAFIIGFCEFIWNVQKVAVDDKVSLFEAFKGEATFAMKFWIRQKPVHTSEFLSRSRRSSRSNIVQSSVDCFNIESKNENNQSEKL